MNERARLKQAFLDGALGKHEYARAMADLNAGLAEYAALLATSDIERVELAADGVWMHSRLAPVAIACDPADRGTPPSVALHFGEYERAEFEMWRRLLPRGAVVADVGANIGWYTAHLAALDPTGRVVAFEPVPSSYAWLRKTVARNALGNVTTEPLALSDAPGSIEIYVDPTISGAASTHPSVYGATSTRVSVEATTLDAYAAAHGLRFDALKIDVEGAELAALQGSARVLSEQRPTVFCEMLRRHARAFGYHPNDIIALMGAHGYGCHALAGGRLRPFEQMDEETVETNFFFLHREAHASLAAGLSG